MVGWPGVANFHWARSGACPNWHTRKTSENCSTVGDRISASSSWVCPKQALTEALCTLEAACRRESSKRKDSPRHGHIMEY
eukprot:4170103-Prorocentrum_lima.AAC.1